MVGVWCSGRFRAAFRCLVSRQIHIDPLRLVEYVMLETQSVVSSTRRMTSSDTMHSSSDLILSLSWTGALRGGCITPCASYQGTRVCFPGSLLMPWKRSGYSDSRCLASLMGTDWLADCVTVQLMLTSPIPAHSGKPKMMGPLVSATTNVACFHGLSVYRLRACWVPKCSMTLPGVWCLQWSRPTITAHKFGKDDLEGPQWQDVALGTSIHFVSEACGALWVGLKRDDCICLRPAVTVVDSIEFEVFKFIWEVLICDLIDAGLATALTTAVVLLLGAELL